MVKLLIVSLICVIFMVAELVGGIIANSLAIMTDAAHLFADLSGFFISIFSLWLAKKPSSKIMSFGYHRAEIIGALASVVLIWILTLFLVYEAIMRIIRRNFEIEPLFMLCTAVFGLICNLVMGKILHSGHGHDHHGHSHGGHGHGHDDHHHDHDHDHYHKKEHDHDHKHEEGEVHVHHEHKHEPHDKDHDHHDHPHKLDHDHNHNHEHKDHEHKEKHHHDRPKNPEHKQNKEHKHNHEDKKEKTI